MNEQRRYSEIYVSEIKDILEQDQKHTSLGSHIVNRKGEVDFLGSGQKLFHKYLRRFGIKKHHKVVDYGCGSLRLGVHFIDFLNTGNYMGIDLISDFYQLGRKQLRILGRSEKNAQFGTIASHIEQAKSFSADFVISSNVAYHVHPSELKTYFTDLQCLTKPGKKLIFDAKLSAREGYYKARHWSWKEGFAETEVNELSLVRTYPANIPVSIKNANHPIGVTYVFQN